VLVLSRDQPVTGNLDEGVIEMQCVGREDFLVELHPSD
jgi:hypothetical protein